VLPLRTPLDARVNTFTELEYASTLVHGRSIHYPYFHPPTHDVPVANIQFRSHHPRLLDLFTHFATHAAYSLGIPISRVYMLPTKRTLWTVLRSPFVHKKSQENFERRVHKRAIKAWDADPEVIDRWFKYLRRHAMGGVGMRTTKWERMPLGVGQARLAHVMDRLETPVSSNVEKIKALGNKIIMEERGAASKPDDAAVAALKE
jgi:small subunit ribosomal protein S10